MDVTTLTCVLNELEPETLNALYTAVGWGDGRTAAKTRLVSGRAACFAAAWDAGCLVGFGRVLADVCSARVQQSSLEHETLPKFLLGGDDSDARCLEKHLEFGEQLVLSG